MKERPPLVKLNDYLWEVPQNYWDKMRVPARAYITEAMINSTEPDAFQQLVNLATLPGIQRYALAMPDMHTGYASPIGGVAAIDIKEGIISPGLCGYDINCGMRVLKSEYSLEEIRPLLDRLASAIQEAVPSGLGRGRKEKLSFAEVDQILQQGAAAMMEQGFGEKKDLEHCEGEGRLNWASAQAVSSLAKERGRDQLGTLGSGNHFLEIQEVVEIYDKQAAEAFGLFPQQIVIMIHTGSRGLGHQVCTDYLRLMMPLMKKYKIEVPDKEFAAVPFSSSEGQRYFQAMAAAANFAWANRQAITFYVRKVWQKILGKNNSSLELLYDVAHNIIKREKYFIDNQEKELLVHRKGATRAFPPESLEIPEDFRKVGQPVLIPGSMGSHSFILRGTNTGEQSFYSTCHGAGRAMSRQRANKTFSPSEIMTNLKKQGIIVKCRSLKGLTEEAPAAYKNIQEVVEVVHQAGLSTKVAHLKPLAVIKGE